MKIMRCDSTALKVCHSYVVIVEINDQPADHRALLYLLLHLQPVKQAGRRTLHIQRGNVDLDQRGGRDSDHPHTQGVGGVGAGVVRWTETALCVSQNSSTTWDTENNVTQNRINTFTLQMLYITLNITYNKWVDCLSVLRVSGRGILAGCGAAELSCSFLLGGIVGKIWDTPSPALSRSGGLVDNNCSSTAWPLISTSWTENSNTWQKCDRASSQRKGLFHREKSITYSQY